MILLRFILGVVLGGSIAVWFGLPPIASAIIVLILGVLIGIWGDKFLLGFMSVLRYLK